MLAPAVQRLPDSKAVRNMTPPSVVYPNPLCSTPSSLAASLLLSDDGTGEARTTASRPVDIPGRGTRDGARDGRGGYLRMGPAHAAAAEEAPTGAPGGGLGSWADRAAAAPAHRKSKMGPPATEGREAAAAAARWRLTFKRAWIKERLHALQERFPDEPGYEDAWDEALAWLRACGPGVDLQLGDPNPEPSPTSDPDPLDGIEGVLLGEEGASDKAGAIGIGFWEAHGLEAAAVWGGKCAAAF
ncbi:hypothetical protein WJX81_001304 [Elliptochloris bilobata]|uniref:Uncharacterized protein n=1 Tax=Elliptochloris bilobata TaxID=381761 RepID=A0AAW1R250_9CHLO